MKELIKIQQDNKGNSVVSARELQKYFENTERFSSWFERQLQYGFVNGVDYVGCKYFNTQANQELQDFAITLDMAKEVSMVQKTEKGKLARQYFIECEKVTKSNPYRLPQTRIEALEELVKAEKEKLLLQQTNSNLKTALDTLNDWSSILRVAKHNNVNENIFEWRKLKNASRKLGYEVKKAPSPRYNYQNLYHLDAFRLVYPQFNYDLPDFAD